MAAYEVSHILIGVPEELRLLLYLHENNLNVEYDDGEVASIQPKGVAIATAVQALYIHKDLFRFASELYEAGVLDKGEQA